MLTSMVRLWRGGGRVSVPSATQSVIPKSHTGAIHAVRMGCGRIALRGTLYVQSERSIRMYDRSQLRPLRTSIDRRNGSASSKRTPWACEAECIPGAKERSQKDASASVSSGGTYLLPEVLEDRRPDLLTHAQLLATLARGCEDLFLRKGQTHIGMSLP